MPVFSLPGIVVPSSNTKPTSILHFCNILLVTQVGPAYSVGMGTIKWEKPKKGRDHMRPSWRRGTSAVCRWHQNYYIFLIWTVIYEGRAGALELLRPIFESQFQHLLHYLSYLIFPNLSFLICKMGQVGPLRTVLRIRHVQYVASRALKNCCYSDKVGEVLL